MLSQKIFSQFPNSANQTLYTLSLQLYNEQQLRWSLFADGVAALRSVETRVVDCGSFSVRLQYNPKRIVSTGAKVDFASIKARNCFLCLDNLPHEQQGVLVNEQFLVLCNPMPIFREHFTLSHVDHIPQSIESQFIPFLSLVKDLSPRYSLFYNGPRCGASAPDHLHFQASPSGLIPVEHEYRVHRKIIKRSNTITISTLERYGRSVIVLEGKSVEGMEQTFILLTSVMREVMKSEEEPMMNIIASYGDEGWTLIIFARGKHRPAVYFQEGMEKIMISPASVDIGGLVVTPMEKDFQMVDALSIIEIFREVSLSDEIFKTIVEKL